MTLADAGMTLVEMMTAMVISSILLMVISRVTVTAFRAARFSTVKSSAAAQGRTSIERMTKLLRVAVVPQGLTGALDSASFDAVRFYSAIKTDSSASDPAPTYLEYYWDGATRCLVEAITPARVLTPVPGSGSPYAWDTGRTTHCLAELATAPTSSAPLFSYYRTPALNADGTSPSALDVTASGLPAASLPLVRSVGITLSTADHRHPEVPAVSYEDRVTLDNLVLAMGGRA